MYWPKSLCRPSTPSTRWSNYQADSFIWWFCSTAGMSTLLVCPSVLPKQYEASVHQAALGCVDGALLSGRQLHGAVLISHLKGWPWFYFVIVFWWGEQCLHTLCWGFCNDHFLIQGGSSFTPLRKSLWLEEGTHLSLLTDEILLLSKQCVCVCVFITSQLANM